jgi:hypothetical protein
METTLLASTFTDFLKAMDSMNGQTETHSVASLKKVKSMVMECGKNPGLTKILIITRASTLMI